MAMSISIPCDLATFAGRGRAFSSWLSMMRRCFIDTEATFHHYGGRGITVCERWFDWRNFLADMGDRPPGLTLDRINVHGHYEPGNCRWADRKTQARNTTRNVCVELQGSTMLACDAAEALGVSRSCISRRLRNSAPLGERRPLKLTAGQVSEIKQRLCAGETLTAIGRDYGITRQHVAGIRDGRVWGHV